MSAVPESEYALARAAANHNLRVERRHLEACMDARVIRLAARIHALAYWPRALEATYVSGLRSIVPRRDERAPIYAFSHKTIRDVFAVLEFFAARPVDRFHDLTIIAQAGLFGGIYAYRDLIPDAWKVRPLVPVLARLARALGERMARFFTELRCYPVYRENRDIPSTAAEYEGRTFAGPRVTGLQYADFVKRAHRVTRESLIHVFADMEERNRAFFVMPEGGYRFDGDIAPLQEFLGVAAYRKQTPTIFGAISYDELCPDFYGRVNAWVRLVPPQAPPIGKADIPDFLERGRQLLREHTTVLASHLIAATALGFGDTSFTHTDFAREFEGRTAALLNGPRPRDPGLHCADYRAERLDRFFRRRARRYLRRERARYFVDPEKLERFARSERTVNDLRWNANHINGE